MLQNARYMKLIKIWDKPLLIPLLRSKLEESLLGGCKNSTTLGSNVFNNQCSESACGTTCFQQTLS